MEIEFAEEENQFRAMVREWLATNLPTEPRPSDGPETRAFDLAWQKRQHEGGWAGIAWPKEHGGAGLSVTQHLIWLEECGRAGAPPLGTLSVALSHAGPTLIALGTESQKQYHLPRILRGESVWCQGFSEPGAGSDLAGIKAKGVVKDDHIVVTGQKIWTSHAHLADYQELLIRTDNSGSRHDGLTWLICDMTLPGISINPIKTITGAHHYCEVFYDEVAVPLSNVVGALNDGWRVAMSTLTFERGAGGIANQVKLAKDVERLITLASETTDPVTGSRLIDREDIVAELAELQAKVAGLRALTYMAVSRAQEGSAGPETSLLGVYYTELSQRIQRAAVQMLDDGILLNNPATDYWIQQYLYSFCQTIMGGTAEIRRNIIAQRVLGLPKL